MDTGVLAQMSYNSFPAASGLAMPSGGLASRRGGQNPKPISIDALKAPTDNKENTVPTPRTSRGHLLAGLRTAPKTATNNTFPPSPVSAMPPSQQTYGRNNVGNNVAPSAYLGREGGYSNAPKTSLPRMPSQQPRSYNNNMMGQHFTPEQILAPPEIYLDEQIQEQMDPSMYAQLVTTNMYLAQQQQRLQQQLLQVQDAAQRFQGLNLNDQAVMQQRLALQQVFQQQQQLKEIQQSFVSSMLPPQQNYYTYVDPATGQQQAFFVDQNQARYNQQANNMYMEQPSTPHHFGFQQQNSTPRVQVSPPATDNEKPFFRSSSPPKKFELTAEPTPLPPPSANAFRRGHKKAPSLSNSKSLSLSTDEPLRSAGPRTSGFTVAPLSSGYGPGQARAGEHPSRQPRGPPAIEELRAKPTCRHEGSKNFAVRSRRSAVSNLVRAGLERRKGTDSSTGSMSPVSETAEEGGNSLTDNESESGRSGSGSLSGDAEPSVSSSRTSTSGSWGAIGSDRPSSRQKSRKSVDSQGSAGESDGSFASVFKNGSQKVRKPQAPEPQRKAPMLVLNSVEKRKNGVVA